MSAVWAVTASTLLCFPSCSEVREFTGFYRFVFLTFGTRTCSNTHTPANLPMFGVGKPPVSSLSKVWTPSIWHLSLPFIFVFSSLIRPVWNKPSWAMLHTYTCTVAVRARSHGPLWLCCVCCTVWPFLWTVMLVCVMCLAVAGVCVFGGVGGYSVFVLINWLRWVTMVTALAVRAVGYVASLSSLSALQPICIKSLYMLTYAQGNRKNSYYWDIVVMWHGPTVPL